MNKSTVTTAVTLVILVAILGAGFFFVNRLKNQNEGLQAQIDIIAQNNQAIMEELAKIDKRLDRLEDD